MALDAAKVLIGTADQQNSTGAIYSCDLIDTANIPTTFAAADTLLATMTASGYVSESGCELSSDMSTTDIREWNRSIVRKVLDTFDNTITWTLIQQDEESWKQAIGDSYVTKTAATTTHGEQLKIELGAHLPVSKTWAIALKDGDARVIIFVPNGQVTALDTITFSATEAIAMPVTLSCYDDGTGNGDTCLIFIDDGKTTT